MKGRKKRLKVLKDEPKGYDCANGQCVAVDGGRYETLAECKRNCGIGKPTKPKATIKRTRGKQ